MDVVAVVDVDAVEMVGGAWVREDRPCFLDLPLPHLESETSPLS